MSLDDEARWQRLHHAYGPAGDVPELLRALARGEDREARKGPLDLWDRIWSALCHQGDTYPASFAAVPHVVAIGAARPPSEQPMFWSFVGAVAGSGAGGRVPGELAPAYQRALQQAESAAQGCLASGLAADDALQVVIALAGIRQQPLLVNGLEGLLDGELAQECADCGGELVITTTAVPFVLAEHDEATGAFTPATAPNPDVHALAARARKAGHDDLAARIAALDVVVRCPGCGARFPVLS